VGGNVKNSFYKSSSGEFFFGGSNGLISFFPDKIKINNSTTPPVFTYLRLANNQKEVTPEDNLLTKDISLTDTIRFRYDQNIFTIGFSSLNYIPSEKSAYTYKLEGLDKDWNFSRNNFITYPFLPPGKYKLLVKGTNSDGVWSKPTSLIIEISPAPWKTWWAYLALLIVLVFVLTIIIRNFLLRALKK